MGFDLLEGFDVYPTGSLNFTGSPWASNGSGVLPIVTATPLGMTGRVSLLTQNGDAGNEMTRGVTGGEVFDYLQYWIQPRSIGGFEARNPGVFLFASSSGLKFGATTGADGRLHLWRGTSDIDQGEATLQYNRTYYIEVMLYRNTGHYWVWLNGVRQMQGQTTPIGDVTALKIQRASGASNVGSFYIDNITHGYDIGYRPPFGAIENLYIYPEADLAPQDWSYSTGGDGYALIDEAPYSDTDYIYSEAEDEECAFSLEDVNLSDFSVYHVFAVQLQYRASKDVAGTANIRGDLIFDNGDVSQTYQGSEIGLSTDWQVQVNEAVDTHPVTGWPFSPSDLHDFSIAFDRVG